MTRHETGSSVNSLVCCFYCKLTEVIQAYVTIDLALSGILTRYDIKITFTHLSVVFLFFSTFFVRNTAHWYLCH